MPENQARENSAEHHVWTPDPERAGEVPFDRFGHALLREIRGREPPRDRLRLGLALAMAIVFQAALIVLLRQEMRPHFSAPAASERENAIQVRFFEAPPRQTPATVVPEINLPPPKQNPPPPRTHIEPRRPHSMTATIGEMPPVAPRLYGGTGQALLPPPSSVAVTPDYRAPQLREPALMKHTTPLPYHSTRFNKDWAPENESLGSKAFRKAVDATTAEKTVHLPGGAKLKCVVSPLMLAFGCGPPPPPPPPKNDNDPRLSLPPPVSLTGKKVTVPAAPSTTALPAKASTAPAAGLNSH